MNNPIHLQDFTVSSREIIGENFRLLEITGDYWTEF